MHCPICGQKQFAENVRFCSSCGFLLTGVSEIVANNGIIPSQSNQTQLEIKDSPRKRGVKQGAMIMLVGCLLIVPILTMLHLATNTEPFFMVIVGISSFFGGILRMIYAWMYQSKYVEGQTPEGNTFAAAPKAILGNRANQQSLPPQQSISANDYIAPSAGSWRETNDLVEVGSVTDSTTKLLEKEQ